MEIIEKKVDLTWRNNMTTEGTVQIQLLTAHDRLLRALKYGGGCWLAAIPALFVPIVHFILVPTLLCAGPVVAFWQWSKDQVMLSGTGGCPGCKECFEISKGDVRQPFEDTCPRCRMTVRISIMS